MNAIAPLHRARGAALLALAALPAWILLTPAALAAPGAHGPNGEHLDAPTAAVSASGLARLPDGSVNVPKAAQRRMAIRTVLASESEAAATFELPGRVIADPNASGRVQTVHGGRIEPGPKGLPLVGQRVAQGELLAHVRHHADPYAEAGQKAQLAELRAQRKMAEQRVRRLEGLEGTVPRKDIDAARTEARMLAERERSIGASLQARESLVASVSGVVARANVAVGQLVTANEVLFDVVDPSRMLVEAVAGDPSLAAQVGAASLRDVPDAKLHLVGAAQVLRDGVLPLVFTVATDKPLPLAIGQPVSVIAQSNQRVRGIVLPAQAVVRNATNEPVVWIKSGAERFIAQPVRFQPLDAGTVVITQGLGADNRVVIQGAPLIAQIR